MSELGTATVPIHNPPTQTVMALTFGNVLLLIALVAVSVHLGIAISKKKWYLKGVNDGIDVGEETCKVMFDALKERYDFVPKNADGTRKAE